MMLTHDKLAAFNAWRARYEKKEWEPEFTAEDDLILDRIWKEI